ncbi:MAG: hypothetical protein S4CHLAM20_06260 [Chlamydiia bacterium]|nr:hypothetical protein [Chlamydiia bacterium]
MKNIIICLIFTSLVYCDLIYPYRDIKNPPISLDEDIAIIQLGPMRSGTTIIYNILKYLFEDECVNVHSFGKVTKMHILEDLPYHVFKKKKMIVCCTFRDPMNVIASVKRAGLNHKKVTDRAKSLNNSYFNIKKIINFKYESFENDQFEYVFNKLENELNIKISTETRNEIQTHFSKNRMKEICSRYSNFGGYDKITGFHGSHINNSDWRNTFNLKQALEIYHLNIDLRRKWGYSDIDVEKEWRDYRESKKG